MKKATTYNEIAASLRKLRKPLVLSYSADGVWFRAEFGVDAKTGKVEEILVTFKYYADSVDTGEAGYCKVRIRGIEFRHWPYNRVDWNGSSWECRADLEEDGVTAAEVSKLINQHIELPDELLVQTVDFQVSELVTKKVALDCFKAKAAELSASYYLNEATGDVYLFGSPDKVDCKLKKVTPKAALEVLWDLLPLTCAGAC